MVTAKDAMSSPSPTSVQIQAALEQICTLGGSILKAQATMLGLDPLHLEPKQLEVLREPLVRAVERFTSPAKAERLRRLLLDVQASPSVSLPHSGTSPLPPVSKGSVDEAPPMSVFRNSFAGQARAQDLEVSVGSGSFAGHVLETLKQHSPLAWSLLEATCTRAKVEPAALTPRTLLTLVPQLEKSLARFTSAQRAAEARRELERLALRHHP